MSVLIKRSNKIHTFPIEIYKHLLLRFNGVTQFNIITISSTTLEISFKKFVGCSTTVPVRLFSKLAIAMKTIKNKYLTYNDIKVHIKIKMIDKDDRFIIRISGINKIPPGKIFNLFGLILYYYLKFISGTKPSLSVYGRELTEKWKIEEKYTRDELKSTPKKIVVTNFVMPCYICGKETDLVLHWQFLFTREKRYIDIQTRVCEKHRSEVL